MYRIGEVIVYGDMGVCRILDIQNLAFAGEEKPYYILKPLFQECMISTPVENTKVFMRPIISKQEANRLIDMIPSIQAKAYYSRILREVSEHYEASLKTHDCESLIELSMSIYAKKQTPEEQNRKFGAIDERFMKRAEELLFGELAAALDIPRDPDILHQELMCLSRNSIIPAMNEILRNLFNKVSFDY